MFAVIVTSGIDLLQHFDTGICGIHIVSVLHLEKHAVPMRYQNKLRDSIPLVLVDKGSTVFDEIVASGINFVCTFFSRSK